jgi:hypothetical protein
MGNEAVGAKRLVVVVCLVGKKPEVRSVEGDELEGLQRIVGGYIEKVASFPFLFPLCVDVYANDMSDGLDLNRLVNGQPIVGAIVLAAANVRTGEQVSLDIEPDLLDRALRLARSFPVVVVTA